MSYFKTKVLAVVAALFMIVPAFSAEYTVYFYSFNPNNDSKQANRFEPVFEPEFLKIEKGDTINFVPKEPRHDSVSIKGLIPEGAKHWRGELDKPITVTFDTEGVYAYECTPHFHLGQAGVIQVGDGFPNKEEFTKTVAKIDHKGGEKIRKLLAENL